VAGDWWLVIRVTLGRIQGYSGGSEGNVLRGAPDRPQGCPNADAGKARYALGQTKSAGLLFAAFTIRRNLIRVSSVRDMNRNEREASASMKEIPKFNSEDDERKFWATTLAGCHD
jgi:hypothetical protein